jgi:polysaccharide deacetylase family protein (PEP-CTERM system associated)
MADHILLTVDVEDWFQVENFRKCIPFSSWSSCELRVEKNTYYLLDILDSLSCQPSALSPVARYEHGPRTTNHEHDSRIFATFFVLGWVAERFPQLIREIQARGHEVASHGYGHRLCGTCTREELESDLQDGKKLLEDVTGAPVNGYRAPSFSISDEAIKLVEQCGFTYDSSYNSFGANKRYGCLSVDGKERLGIAYRFSPGFYEIPVSNLSFGSRVLPWGGGGYFRLIPYWVFRRGIGKILERDGAYLFYMHPWELDTEQPRVREAPLLSRFRHYVNLGATESRVTMLVQDFDWAVFVSCKQYLDGLTTRLSGRTGQA